MRRITLPTGVLTTALGVLALAAPASAVTSSPLGQAEAWQQIARDNLRDLGLTETWQQIAGDNLRDLQAAEAWQGIARDNLRHLRVQERRDRRQANRGH